MTKRTAYFAYNTIMAKTLITKEKQNMMLVKLEFYWYQYDFEMSLFCTGTIWTLEYQRVYISILVRKKSAVHDILKKRFWKQKNLSYTDKFHAAFILYIIM